MVSMIYVENISFSYKYDILNITYTNKVQMKRFRPNLSDSPV